MQAAVQTQETGSRVRDEEEVPLSLDNGQAPNDKKYRNLRLLQNRLEKLGMSIKSLKNTHPPLHKLKSFILAYSSGLLKILRANPRFLPIPPASTILHQKSKPQKSFQ